MLMSVRSRRANIGKTTIPELYMVTQLYLIYYIQRRYRGICGESESKTLDSILCVMPDSCENAVIGSELKIGWVIHHQD